MQLLDKCNDACAQLINVVTRYMNIVDALWREGYVEEAYRIGLTGYITASILSDTYVEDGLITPDFHTKFKRVLAMVKDFVYSLNTNNTVTTSVRGIIAAFENITSVEAVARVEGNTS